MQATLRVENVSKIFHAQKQNLSVLKGISYTFEQGKMYGLHGASGSGKSTLLNLLAGLDEPSGGKVFYCDRSLATFSAEQRAQFLRTGVGVMFQAHYLLEELSVLENIMMPLLIARKTPAEAEKSAYELLDIVGLRSKALMLPSELSGGEQQRVAAMRALANKPAFLIADEPTGNLDAINAHLLLDFIIECQKLWGMGVIMCSHDVILIERCNTVLTLQNGILVQE